MRQIADPIYNAEVDHLGNIWLKPAVAASTNAV